MKRNKAIDFLTVTLFFGILLTFLVYVGIGTVMGVDPDDDGSKSFNDMFYADSFVGDSVRLIDYRIFRHIKGDNIIIGKDGWLFEAVDSENGYERLLDYIGGNSFSDEELKKIADNMQTRKQAYEDKGMSYMMIVIPDSVTVCDDQMPWYLGKQSENTRLAQLRAYLEKKDINALIDMTSKMQNEGGDIPMYNNTENSINAYGAFCVYNTVVSRYLADTGREVDRIYRDDVEFYTRLTDGKRIAQLSGLEQSIKNRTVSLTDNMPDDYIVTYNEKGFMITERTVLEGARSECVVVECANDWDRTQLMPYFSNTFERVYYRSKLMEQPYTAEQYGATLVVQIIHESELGQLVK